VAIARRVNSVMVSITSLLHRLAFDNPDLGWPMC
jgi:hypothetical protein